MTLRITPLTPDLWPAFEGLFGPERGGNSGCWCMWPRISRADWTALGKAGRKEGFRALVEQGPPPGLLAFDGETAVAWVAVGPRPSVQRFNTMKNSALAADSPASESIFAITCFYIRNSHRRRGLNRLMAEAAVAFAQENGAAAIEVCAIEADRPLVWGDGFVGIASVFRELAFEEVARRAPRRPLMRKWLQLAD